MPTIIHDFELRYISQGTSIPDGWIVVNNLSDAELLPIAREYIKNKIKTEAEGKASNVYDFPYPIGFYTYSYDILIATEFNPALMSDELKVVQQIAQQAKDAITDTSTMDLPALDGYDWTVTPWTVL